MKRFGNNTPRSIFWHKTSRTSSFQATTKTTTTRANYAYVGWKEEHMNAVVQKRVTSPDGNQKWMTGLCFLHCIEDNISCDLTEEKLLQVQTAIVEHHRQHRGGLRESIPAYGSHDHVLRNGGPAGSQRRQHAGGFQGQLGGQEEAPQAQQFSARTGQFFSVCALSFWKTEHIYSNMMGHLLYSSFFSFFLNCIYMRTFL